MGQGESVETQRVTEEVEPHSEPLSQERLLVIWSSLNSKLLVAAFCLCGMKCESLRAGWSSRDAEKGAVQPQPEADAPACVPKGVQLYQHAMLKT